MSSDICYIYSDPAEIEEFAVVLSGDCIGRIPRVGDIYPSSQHDFGLLKSPIPIANRQSHAKFLAGHIGSPST